VDFRILGPLTIVGGAGPVPLRTGREQLSEIVGADAATITAEDWPVK